MGNPLTSTPFPARRYGGPVEFRVSDAPVPYPEAVAFMEERVKNIRAGTASECVWFLEHPSLYTAGTSAKPADLLAPGRFPVFPSGRGGEYTYHGPGQRVAYVMLDLNRADWSGGPDVRKFVHNLEAWLIETLARLGVAGERRMGRIGIWVDRGLGREDKIAALGIRVRHWIAFHGVALNVAPVLEHFSGIVPCGISGHGVTSLEALGRPATMAQADAALRAAFTKVFGVEI